MILHGLVHLMGTTVYMKLGTIEGLPYKTALVSGRWELGESGMRLFGALWVLPALGFVVGAVLLLASMDNWLTVVVGATILSLVMTVLDWEVAFRGAIVNVVILLIAALVPLVRARLAG